MSKNLSGKIAAPFRGALALLLLAAWGLSASGAAWGVGYTAIRRDTFPVFNNPSMLSIAEAEARGVVLPRDAVIGVAHNGEAKAYPINIMGYHELGNDTLGGLPIAVSW